ncbi:MAG: hypothetical protein GDA51_09205 [Ekhidna sp.]|nr:hypothetical protein [Ekhidna sp.]
MKVSLISFINKGSFSSSKHVCVHQRKLRESGEPVARCPVLKNKSECFVKVERTATMLLSLF